MADFLNNTGLAYYHNRIKTIFASKSEIPENVSDLVNDSGYQTASDVTSSINDALANSGDPYQTESDVEAAIDAALAGVTGIDFQVVQALPASGEKGVIYLVSNSGSGTNVYDEYIWVEPTGGTAHFEKIGTTDVDLSDYWTSASGKSNSLVAITTAQIDTIVSS